MQQDIEIRDDIPLPDPKCTRVFSRKYEPVLRLNVGQSVWFPAKDGHARSTISTAISQETYTKGGRKYATRNWSRHGSPNSPILPNDDPGVRVWRIK